jgi:hypothetical protein
VHDAALVGFGDRFGDRTHGAQRVAFGQRPLGQARAQRLAIEELEREIRPAFVTADRVERDDVRVREGRRGPRLLQESLDHTRRQSLAAHQLQRDPSAQHQVLREVHLAHRALADQRLDAVVPDPRVGAQPTARCGVHPVAVRIHRCSDDLVPARSRSRRSAKRACTGQPGRSIARPRREGLQHARELRAEAVGAVVGGQQGVHRVPTTATRVRRASRVSEARAAGPMAVAAAEQTDLDDALREHTRSPTRAAKNRAATRVVERVDDVAPEAQMIDGSRVVCA